VALLVGDRLLFRNEPFLMNRYCNPFKN